MVTKWRVARLLRPPNEPDEPKRRLWLRSGLIAYVERRSAIGATSPLPRVPATVPSRSDLQTLDLAQVAGDVVAGHDLAHRRLLFRATVGGVGAAGVEAA